MSGTQSARDVADGLRDCLQRLSRGETVVQMTGRELVDEIEVLFGDPTAFSMTQYMRLKEALICCHDRSWSSHEELVTALGFVENCCQSKRR